MTGSFCSYWIESKGAILSTSLFPGKTELLAQPSHSLSFLTT